MDKIERLSRKFEMDENTDKLNQKQADKYEDCIHKLKRALREAKEYAKQTDRENLDIFHSIEEKAAEIMEHADERKSVLEARYAANKQLALVK